MKIDIRVKGFFVSIVDLNTKVVEDDIRNQEKEDMVQDNLSTKEHINRTFYVRITISLIYRNSKMFTHKKSAPKGALILNSLTIIYRSVHLISLCVYLLPPLR